MDADTLSTMLEPEIKELAGVEAEPRAADRIEERRWWLAIVAVLAANMLAMWLVGQLF